MAHQLSRRQLPARLAAAGLGAAVFGAGAARSADDPTPGLVHNADAIHQTISYKAPPQRVYDALTKADQFDRVFRLGKAFKTMKLGAAPTVIGPNVGDAFALFGGYIVGRTLYLKPGERIVQSWREMSWEAHEVSLISFGLAAEGGGTRVTFDQCGFPPGGGDHLAIGWYNDYWDPLRKFLDGAG